MSSNETASPPSVTPLHTVLQYMSSNESTNPPSVLQVEEMGGSLNAQIAPLRRNPNSFDWLMNVTAKLTGQRNRGNDPQLPLTETDMIHVDKFKLAQVVRNLVSNALKFSPRGSVATLHAVFVPSTEAVVVADEHPAPSYVRQMMSRIYVKLRKSGAVSAEIIAPPPTGQYTAGFLRISVIDHG